MSVRVSDYAEAAAPLIDIPAMICQMEKNFYYWLTSNHAFGDGAVVECGSWLGASTAYLAAGMPGRTIHCFEGFRWSELNNWKSHHKLAEGADFTHLFLENMARYDVPVVVHQSELEAFVWSGDPIEIINIDLGKYLHEVESVLAVFGPSFIPGQTRVVYQDYQYFPGYQIAVALDSLRSSLELEHVVVDPKGRNQPNAVCFRVTAPIDLAALKEAAASFRTWSPERIHETWARIIEPLPEQTRARMAPGLALFLYDAGHVREARKALAERRWTARCRGGGSASRAFQSSPRPTPSCSPPRPFSPANGATAPAYPASPWRPGQIGAGRRDRTDILSLEGCCTTIVLYPRPQQVRSNCQLVLALLWLHGRLCSWMAG
jgi:hypothetical protein